MYTTPLSANGRKVLAVSRQLGLNAEIHLINVYKGEGRTAEYLAINPSGRIPTLADGEFVLFESNAILLYLDEAHGGHALTSSDLRTRSRVTQWLFWESAHWQPSLSAVLSELVAHRLFPQRLPAPRSAPDWSNGTVQALLGTLEATLSAQPFLTGSMVTLADFSVAGMTTYFKTAGFPFHEYRAVSRWCARMDELDSWRATESPLWAACGKDPRTAG
jgi:glutathione S-transferase